MQRDYSNKTIPEVDERSGTCTDITPFKSASVSPYLVHGSQPQSPKIYEEKLSGENDKTPIVANENDSEDQILSNSLNHDLSYDQEENSEHTEHEYPDLDVIHIDHEVINMLKPEKQFSFSTHPMHSPVDY